MFLLQSTQLGINFLGFLFFILHSLIAPFSAVEARALWDLENLTIDTDPRMGSDGFAVFSIANVDTDYTWVKL